MEVFPTITVRGATLAVCPSRCSKGMLTIVCPKISFWDPRPEDFTDFNDSTSIERSLPRLSISLINGSSASTQKNSFFLSSDSACSLKGVIRQDFSPETRRVWSNLLNPGAGIALMQLTCS